MTEKESYLMKTSLFFVHVTTWHFQCERLTDHVTFNFNDVRNMSTLAVFVDNVIALDKIISKDAFRLTLSVLLSLFFQTEN
jgi:hypothetical protein